MNVRNYLGNAESVVGVRRNVARIADVLGADRRGGTDTALAVASPPAGGGAVDFLRKFGGTPRDVPDGARTAVGIAAGAVLGTLLDRESRLRGGVLGAIGGGSLARNIPALFDPDYRRLAGRNLTTTGFAIAGSVLAKAHPVWGFMLGWLVGGAAAYFAGLK